MDSCQKRNGRVGQLPGKNKDLRKVCGHLYVMFSMHLGWKRQRGRLRIGWAIELGLRRVSMFGISPLHAPTVLPLLSLWNKKPDCHSERPYCGVGDPTCFLVVVVGESTNELEVQGRPGVLWPIRGLRYFSSAALIGRHVALLSTFCPLQLGGHNRISNCNWLRIRSGKVIHVASMSTSSFGLTLCWNLACDGVYKVSQVGYAGMDGLIRC